MPKQCGTACLCCLAQAVRWAPLLFLQSLGAQIVAVDLNRPDIWKRLTDLGTAAPTGSVLYCPTRSTPNGTEYGVNMITETVEVAEWLVRLLQEPDLALKEVVLGAYAYLDGALHVQVALAMDIIIHRLTQTLGPRVSVAFLCTPTDVHVTTQDARVAVVRNLGQAPAWQRLLLGIRVLTPNLAPNTRTPDGQVVPVVDGLVRQQGPNYALAKRLQHWRAILLRHAGHRVSSNVAPSTATVSVVHNPQFAAAYGGPDYPTPPPPHTRLPFLPPPRSHVPRHIKRCHGDADAA